MRFPCRTRGLPLVATETLVALMMMMMILATSGSTVAGRGAEGELTVSEVSAAVEFLTRFGYLPPTDGNTGNLLSDSEFRDAIREMQRFGALAQTGRVDRRTVELMRAKRCGVPDLVSTRAVAKIGGAPRIRRYAIQGQKWPKTNLTWSVRSDASSASSVPTVRAQLRRAFSVWSRASALTFSELERTTEPAKGRGSSTADILVSFLKGSHGDGYPFDGEGSVLAHAFFPGEGIGGDAHFDAEERWTSIREPRTEDEGVNLFAVAAHEIGHSLGLSHSSTPGSLMFPYYQVLGDKFELPSDDAEGIRHLYGSKGAEVKPPDPSAVPTVPTTTVQPRIASTVATKTTTTVATKKVTTVATKKTTTVDTKTTTKEEVSTTPNGSSAAVPPSDLCRSSIDAISLIRREIFVFKGKYFWRLHTNRTLRAGYPVSIDRFWYDLPPDVTRIDAIYERPLDTKIVFFSGRRYWVFSANQPEPGYPKPLTDLGLPVDLERIDAALVWGHNAKTYLFSGALYWKLDETEGRVELDYPRSVGAWRGVPPSVDAAFQWTDGNTYFFKDNKFWKFVDAKMRIEKKSPSEIGGFWFHCPSKTTVGGWGPPAEVPSSAPGPDAPLTSAAAMLPNPETIVPYMCLLFLIYWSRNP